MSRLPALVSAVTALGFLFACSQQTETGMESQATSSPAATENSQSDGPEKALEYKPVDPKEIACALKDYNYDGVVAEGGGVEPIGGHIGEFHCGLGFDAGSKIIDLSVNEFKDGGVVTKDFGIIRVRFSSSLTSGGYMLMMTDKQKEEIKVFLAK